VARKAQTAKAPPVVWSPTKEREELINRLLAEFTRADSIVIFYCPFSSLFLPTANLGLFSKPPGLPIFLIGQLWKIIVAVASGWRREKTIVRRGKESGEPAGEGNLGGL
jgi:hypothetical protein